MAAAFAIAACGGVASAGGGVGLRTSSGGAPSQSGSVAPVQIYATVPLVGAGAGHRMFTRPTPFSRPLGSTLWAVSFDVRLPAGSGLAVDLGYGGPVVLTGGAGSLTASITGAAPRTLEPQPGWLGGGWWHIEATNRALAIDGRSLPVRASIATTITLRATRGRPVLDALIDTGAEDRGSLLLHRLAELHARLAAGQFPVGADLSDGLHIDSTYWTSGFWPGALWQAAALEGTQGRLLAQWALSATVAHFGQERSDTHDVGFMYGQSSLAAWRALCRGRPATSGSGLGGAAGSGLGGASGPVSLAALCGRLRQSVLSAADELLALAADNPGAGTIPTNSTSGDTIIDSMMNIAILPWAGAVTGNPAYDQLASRHAHVVASLLVRPDGSTAQSVNFDPATGRVLLISTHQGLSDSSTWSRGEGWAVYGFAQAAGDLRDRGLLRIALRAASYVAGHLPPSAIPPWDYDAPAGAPVDVSAGVITADGMFHLATACGSLPGVCADPGRWVALGRRMLSAALTRASASPPLGFLRSQVLNQRGAGCWCDGGELIFGLSYALEGLRLEQATAG